MSTKRKGKSPLTIRERTIIEVRYQDGLSMREIGKEIERDVGTISREIRGKPRRGIGRYRAEVAHKKAWERIQKRGNTSKIQKNTFLREYIIQKLKIGWSPEQISLRLSLDFSKEKSMYLSHEAIYQYIYHQIHRNGHGDVKRGCEDLRIYLPRRRKRRMKKGFRKIQKLERRETIPSIDNRPCIVEARERIGDWEDDFIVSRNSMSCIKSINERRSGLVFFKKTKNKTALSGDEALFQKLSCIPKKYRKTLTRDNGSENKNYKEVERRLGMDVYFAHPYHSWERGNNENCNELFRRFFPKKTDFDALSDEEIDYVEYLINTRPRKRHCGFTPAEVFYKETGVALFS